MIPLAEINNEWTLFIDRDGVINHEKANDYVHTWEEFSFYDGVFEAFETFTGIFKYIIVVTNQKGVGKGLTKENDLLEIHHNMKAAIEQHGGRIDAIYYCPDLDNDSPNRKPQPGMGLQAKEKFKDIDLFKSLMVGNTLSDMHFGRNLGVHTVFLSTTRPEVKLDDESIDAAYTTLHAFSQTLL